MRDEINIEEFNNRIETVVPGDISSDSQVIAPLTQIKFSKLSKKDLEDIHSYSLDKKLYEYLEYAPFKNLDETNIFLNKLLSRMKKNNGVYHAYYWSVRHKHEKQIIGTASISNINFDRKSLEWGYAIDPAKWGLGFILDIQESLKHYIFDVLKINRLYGLTMLNNRRTISSLKAAGMREEGILRQSHRKESKYFDGWKYSMLHQEYMSDNIKNIQYNEVNNNQINVEQIISLVSHLIEEDDLHLNSSMTVTPKWDSLSHMIIIEALCETFNLEIKPKDIHRLTSIKKIHSFLNSS